MDFRIVLCVLYDGSAHSSGCVALWLPYYCCVFDICTQVTVDWEAVPVTAQSSDFIPQSGTVELADGVSSVTLPLSIINDSEPEFAETLSVSLVASGGGAGLDGTLTATVTITASDDPNGALRKLKLG